MHGSVLGWFISAVNDGDARNKDVLEVGSLDVNGTIRPMIQVHKPRSYIGVDILEGPNVDQLVNCERLTDTFGPNCADLVVTAEMLEHVDDWQQCIRQLIAAVRPGGVLMITTRSIGFPFHHPPDCWRYSLDSMLAIFNRASINVEVAVEDPEQPGVFIRARKPAGWAGWDENLDDISGVTPVGGALSVLSLPFAPDGCGYYRMWQPANALARNTNHTMNIPPPGITYMPTFQDVDRIDVIIYQRPGGGIIQRDWQRWVGRTALIYETDDNVFQVDNNLPNWKDETLIETSLECLKVADMVTVSTEPLAEHVRQHNDRVAVIPNFIHEDLLKIQRPKNDRLTVCWAGGATHLQDLAMVQNPLNAALDAHPGVDMHWIGVDYSPLLRRECRFTVWQSNIWDYYQTLDGDLAIAPLRSTPFNDSRSSIKALEYAALGIPVVASNVEPYRNFVVDGVTGYLARDEDEWQTRITELINDEAARTEMGAKAKELAAGWTIQTGWRQWADIIEKVVGNGTG